MVKSCVRRRFALCLCVVLAHTPAAFRLYLYGIVEQPVVLFTRIFYAPVHCTRDSVHPRHPIAAMLEDHRGCSLMSRARYLTTISPSTCGVAFHVTSQANIFPCSCAHECKHRQKSTFQHYLISLFQWKTCLSPRFHRENRRLW